MDASTNGVGKIVNKRRMYTAAKMARIAAKRWARAICLILILDFAVNSNDRGSCTRYYKCVAVPYRLSDFRLTEKGHNNVNGRNTIFPTSLGMQISTDILPFKLLLVTWSLPLRRHRLSNHDTSFITIATAVGLLIYGYRGSVTRCGCGQNVELYGLTREARAPWFFSAWRSSLPA